jgi:hypothetical protein
MTSLKKSLHNTIDRLSEPEARQVLNYAKQVHSKSGLVGLMEELSHDSAIAVSSVIDRPYKRVSPVRGKGVAASKLLVKDRR